MSSQMSRLGVLNSDCPSTHQILPIAGGTCSGIPARAYDEEAAEEVEEVTSICLTCLLASLAPQSFLEPFSLRDHRQHVELLLTALTQQCPSFADTPDLPPAALCQWVRDTLNPSRGGPAGTSARRHSVEPLSGGVGVVVANILEALFVHIAHHGESVTVSAQHGSEDGCSAAFLELVLFVFAVWEVVLWTPAEDRGGTRGVATRAHPGAAPRLLARGVDAGSYPGAVVPLTATSPGETALTFRFPAACFGESPSLTRDTRERQSTTQIAVEGAGEACYGLETDIVELESAVAALVGRVVDVVVRLQLAVRPTEADASNSRRPVDPQCQMSHTAVSLLHAMASKSPLFARVLRDAGHLCTFARVALPSYVTCCTDISALPTRKRERGSHLLRERALSQALQLLQRLLQGPSQGAGLASAGALDALAAQLVAPAVLSATEAQGVAVVEASLLPSLLRVMEMPALTVHALRLLVVVLAWPATRAQYFLEARSSEEGEEAWRGTELLGETSAVMESDAAVVAAAPGPLALATLLSPLLLRTSGEVVQLTCKALLTLLTSLTVCDAGTTFSSSSSRAQRAASVAVAEVVEGYAVLALDTCVEGRLPLCDDVVALLERVAAILAEAEASASAAPSSGAAGPRTDWQESWRLVFRVATVDAKLFNRLLSGPILRRSLRRPVANTADSSLNEEGGVDWNPIVSGAAGCVSDTPALSLHAYLHLLDALATAMGTAIRVVQPDKLRCLVASLSERLEKHVHTAAARGAAAAATAATTSSGDEHILLHRLLEPHTHLLLVYVVAAYLPHTGAVLHRVALLLLTDVVHARTLVTYRSSAPAVRTAPLAHRTAVGAAGDPVEGECRCLLAMAAHLLETHNALPVDVSRLPLRDARNAAGVWREDLPCPCWACDDLGDDGQLYLLHGLCAPSTAQQPQEYGTPVDSLLDVLLSICPESLALVDARVRLVHAILHDSASPPPSAWTPVFALRRPRAPLDGPSALVGVSSVAGLLAVYASYNDAARPLLALSTWMPLPCVEDGAVVRLAQAAMHCLESAMHEAALHMTHATDDGVAAALQCYLALLLVRLRWFSNPFPPSLSTPPPTLPENEEGGEAGVERALLLRVMETPVLQREVTGFWFYAATHYRVDACGALRALSQQRAAEEIAVAPARPHLLLLSTLAAATVLSALVCAPALAAEVGGAESGSDATAVVSFPTAATPAVSAAILAYVRRLTSYHWLAEVYLAACSAFDSRDAAGAGAGHIFLDGCRVHVTAVGAAALFLSAVFREAATMAVRSEAESVQERERRLRVESGVRYVLEELLHLLQLREECGKGRNLRENADMGLHRPAPATAATHLLVQHILRDGLVPFLREGLLREAPSIYVRAGDVTTLTVLRLASLSLWCLRPSECTECDAVLAQYVLKLFRQCQGLTQVQVEQSFESAEGATGADNVDGGGSAVGRERERFSGVRCIDELPCFTLHVIQLFYLLLQRPNRNFAARADQTAARVWTATANVAASARTTRMKRGCIDLRVLAMLVENSMEEHNPRELNPGEPTPLWLTWIWVDHYLRAPPYRDNFKSSLPQAWPLLAGYDILVPPIPLTRPLGPIAFKPLRHRSMEAEQGLHAHERDRERVLEALGTNDMVHGEMVVARPLFTLCADAIIGLLSTRFSKLDRSGVWNVVLVARLLAKLLYHFGRALRIELRMLSLLATFCTGLEGDLVGPNPTRQDLLAEGWLLVGLMEVLPMVEGWQRFRPGLEERVRRFSGRPVVTQMLTAVSPAPLAHGHPATAGSDEDDAAAGGGDAIPARSGDDDADEDVELRVLVCSFVTSVRRWEASVEAQLKTEIGYPYSGPPQAGVGISAPSLGPLLPGGVLDVEVDVLHYWVPFAVPTTLSRENDGVPLLLISRGPP